MSIIYTGEIREVQEKLEDLSKVLSDTNKLIGLDRLLKLANHGINGKQVQQVFDIGHYHGMRSDPETKVCYSSGCMIGECPGVFEEWIWDDSDNPCLKTVDPELGSTATRISAIRFFNINQMELNHLFYENNQSTEYNYKEFVRLKLSATKEQVGENMLDFIQYKIRDIQTLIKEENQ